MIEDSLIYKIYILKFIVLLNSVFLNCNLHLTEKKIKKKKVSNLHILLHSNGQTEYKNTTGNNWIQKHNFEVWIQWKSRITYREWQSFTVFFIYYFFVNVLTLEYCPLLLTLSNDYLVLGVPFQLLSFVNDLLFSFEGPLHTQPQVRGTT